MASVLDELKAKKALKHVKVCANIDSDLKEKIDYICLINELKVDEYLTAIIVDSEISKEYSKLKKAEEKSVKASK